MKAASGVLIAAVLAGSVPLAGGCTTAHQAWTATKLTGGVIATSAATIIMCQPLRCPGGDGAYMQFTAAGIGLATALLVGVPSLLAAAYYTLDASPPSKP